MKIILFHAKAGYGHQKVAEVIQDNLLKKRNSPQTEVYLEDALESTPVFFRKTYPALYYFAVKYAPAVWGLCFYILDKPAVYKFIRPLRTLFNRIHGLKLLKRMREMNPDIIVCTHFYSAELFASAKKRGEISARLITVVTDFVPHYVWINEGTDVYWVMSDEGAKVLIDRGVSPDRVQAKGIPVDAAIMPHESKEELLEKHSLEQKRFTLLITSGSFGLGPSQGILESLKQFARHIQCFVVCGNNQSAVKELEGQNYPFPVKVFGFVNFMPELMKASELMVAKSGGATTSESLAMGLPMVVLKPIPGQEEGNALVLRLRNASFFIERPQDLTLILDAILKNPSLYGEKMDAIKSLGKPSACDDLVTYLLN